MASTLISVLDGQLAATLDQQLTDGQLEAAHRTLADNAELLHANCADAVSTIVHHLTDDNFADRPDTFVACERLLMHVAETVSVEDALFELLEVIETTRSDNVFTSTLKAMQICIRRQREHKVRSLEWCLNSILTYVGGLAVPDRVRENTDGDAAAQLFEDDDQVRRILSNYLTLFLFYEPVMQQVIESRDGEPLPVYRSVRLTRANVLVSFLLQLLGAPFHHLNLQRPDDDGDIGGDASRGDDMRVARAGTTKTNTYSWQCASTIVDHLMRLYPDPFVLLACVEQRQRWPDRPAKATPVMFDDQTVVDQPPPMNVFANEEKTPTLCIATLFYLLNVERLLPATAPKIYTTLYVLEGNLYLLAAMLATNVHSLHSKAMRLADVVLRQQRDPIPVESLGLHVHERFCTQLCRVITQSPCRQNSQHGAQILRSYVMRFDDAGRVTIVSNLLRTVQHGGLLGHIATMYKDMVAAALAQHDVKTLPDPLCGVAFRTLLLRRICRLANGPETDLLKHSDELVTALNVLHFLVLGDRSNRTGFWDVAVEVQSEFLEPLRRGIELTRSHYGLEERRVASGADLLEAIGEGGEKPVEFSVQMPDGDAGDGDGALGPVDREAKLKLLRSAMTTFDLMESLLAAVERGVRGRPKM